MVQYAGEKWRLYIGDDDFSGFNEISGVHSLESDNDSDEVTRNFIDGENLNIPTNFVGKLNFVVTDVSYENMKNIAEGYVYDPDEEIDGLDGVTAGAEGAVTVGVQKSSSTQGLKTLKLVPLVASQSKNTQYVANATVSISDKSNEDGLLEYTISVSGKLVDGDLEIGS